MTTVEQSSPETEGPTDKDMAMQESFGEPEPSTAGPETEHANIENIAETADELWQELFGATPEEMKAKVATLGPKLSQTSRRFTETIPYEIDNLVRLFGYDRPGALDAAQVLAGRIDNLQKETDHSLRAVAGLFQLSQPEKLGEYYEVAKLAQAQLDERAASGLASEEDKPLQTRLAIIQEAIKLADNLIINPGNTTTDLRQLGNWYGIHHSMMPDPEYDLQNLRRQRPGVPAAVTRSLEVLSSIHNM